MLGRKIRLQPYSQTWEPLKAQFAEYGLYRLYGKCYQDLDNKF